MAATRPRSKVPIGVPPLLCATPDPKWRASSRDDCRASARAPICQGELPDSVSSPPPVQIVLASRRRRSQALLIERPRITAPAGADAGCRTARHSGVNLSGSHAWRGAALGRACRGDLEVDGRDRAGRTCSGATIAESRCRHAPGAEAVIQRLRASPGRSLSRLPSAAIPSACQRGASRPMQLSRSFDEATLLTSERRSSAPPISTPRCL